MHSQSLIILGMHRSGTSALMGAMDAMGVHVGEPSELTAKNWENPKGFFERRDARRICDALLHGSGADWWKVSAFSPEAVPEAVRAEQDAAIQAMLAGLNAHPVWALKEPRLCLLLPFFQSHLRRPLMLHIVRHPVEVAFSLQRRNGFSLQAGLALWERYNRDALAHAGDRPRVTLNYHALLDHPVETLTRIATALGDDQAALDVEAGAATLDPALRRNRPDPEWMHMMSDAQQALWEALSTGDTPPAWSAEARTLNNLCLTDFERVEAFRAEQVKAARQAGRQSKTPPVEPGKDEAHELRQRLRQTKQALAELRASRSWRLTRPLRALKRFWRGRFSSHR